MNEFSYQNILLQVKAYKILQLKLSKVLEPFFLTYSEWFIISMVFAQKDGIRFSDIANILQVERPHITILVETLEKKGLIEVHGHPKDKRAKLLFLTLKAKQLVPKIEIALSHELSSLTQGLTEQEFEVYKHVLETMVKNGS